MKYHLSSLFTIIIWSLTYISTKILLKILTPIEISLYRFLIGYIFLCIIRPPKKFKINIKDDFNLIISGFLGIFLYYVVENTATNLTQASHVAIIVSTIPLITSILAHYINRDEKFTIPQLITFIISFTGIGFILLEGNGEGKSLPIGNILALLGAVTFGFYNIFLKRIDVKLDPVIKARKINFYGLLFILILFIITGPKNSIPSLLDVRYISHILFLGVLASGICILLWSYSISGIGAIKTSKYIYLAPLITSLASRILLNEEITTFKILGISLIVFGMLIPELWLKRDKRVKTLLT